MGSTRSVGVSHAMRRAQYTDYIVGIENRKVACSVAERFLAQGVRFMIWRCAQYIPYLARKLPVLVQCFVVLRHLLDNGLHGVGPRLLVDHQHDLRYTNVDRNLLIDNQ